MHADPLDTIWSATRPEAPSPQAFDAMWAEVTARAAEPEILPMPGFANWKRWALGAAILAQAAALLVAATSALGPPRPVVEVAKAAPAPPAAPKLHDYRVDAGFTTFVVLDARGEVKAVEARPQATDDSETDIVAAESDVLSFMESYE